MLFCCSFLQLVEGGGDPTHGSLRLVRAVCSRANIHVSAEIVCVLKVTVKQFVVSSVLCLGRGHRENAFSSLY